MNTKTPAAWDHEPIPYIETGRTEPVTRERSLVWSVGATIVAMIIGMVVGVAWTTAAPAEPQPLPASCVTALHAARLISADSRYDWDEAQAWINAGAMGQYADQRADAEAIVRKTDAQVSAREDRLEAAQATFTTALKGCTA
jgi:hypothetical protein